MTKTDIIYVFIAIAMGAFLIALLGDNGVHLYFIIVGLVFYSLFATMGYLIFRDFINEKY